MERKIKVDDYVRITPELGFDAGQIYVVTSIEPKRGKSLLEVVSIDDKSDVKNIVYNNKSCLIKGDEDSCKLAFGSTIEELQPVMPSQSAASTTPGFQMTGITGIDITILNQMDDKTLATACQIDRYTAGLCRNDELWANRLRMKYPDAVPYKNVSTALKDYYLHLARVERFEQDRLVKLERRQAARIRLPTVGGESRADYAAKRGYLDVLKWLASINEYPGQLGANQTSIHGRLDVLKWLNSEEVPEDRRILPNIKARNFTMGKRSLPVLQWLATQDIYPNDYFSALSLGSLDILQWAASLPPPHRYEPSRIDANKAAAKGRLNILKWMAAPPYNIYPSAVRSSITSGKTNLDTLRWLASHNIYPDQYAINNLAEKGQLDELKYVETLPITPNLPNVNGANYAVKRGFLEVLQWLGERGIYPDSTGAVNAVKFNHHDVLKWILESVPDMTFVAGSWGGNRMMRAIIQKGYLDILIFLAEVRSAFHPTHIFADYAAEKGQVEILKWMAAPPYYILPRVDILTEVRRLKQSLESGTTLRISKDTTVEDFAKTIQWLEEKGYK